MSIKVPLHYKLLQTYYEKHLKYKGQPKFYSWQTKYMMGKNVGQLSVACAWLLKCELFEKRSSINYGRGKREGVSHISILLHQHYLFKWSTKGWGVSKSPKNCPRRLLMTHIHQILNVLNLEIYPLIGKLSPRHFIKCKK